MYCWSLKAFGPLTLGVNGIHFLCQRWSLWLAWSLIHVKDTYWTSQPCGALEDNKFQNQKSFAASQIEHASNIIMI